MTKAYLSSLTLLFTALTLTSSTFPGHAEDTFNLGNRFLRWRVDNSLTASVTDNQATPGQPVNYTFNTNELGQRWYYQSDTRQIRGLNNYCLTPVALQTLTINDCTVNTNQGITWRFDEFRRAVLVDPRNGLRCLDLGENNALLLSECSDSLRQKFELEGTNQTDTFNTLSELVQNNGGVDNGTGGNNGNSGETPQQPGATQSITEVLANRPEYSSLKMLVDTAGLQDELETGNMTLFAPTNEALDKLPQNFVLSLLEPMNSELLRGILLYHTTPEVYTLAELNNSNSVVTNQGENIAITRNNDTLVLNNRLQVIQDLDIQATNGVIHSIDSLLTPPTLNLDTMLSTGVYVNNLQVNQPVEGSTLQGEQTFSVELINYNPQDYDVYWQVDGGQLNLMHSGDVSKFATTDVSTWAWNEDNTYILTFIARNKAGQLLATRQLSVSIPSGK